LLPIIGDRLPDLWASGAGAFVTDNCPEANVGLLSVTHEIQGCQRQMSEGEPAYRLAVGYSGKWYDRFGSSIGSICESCATNLRLPPKWYSGARCSHCSRPTFIHQQPHKSTRRYVCSQECRQASNYARRRRSAKLKASATCGELFIPERKDALYCSRRCKQRAYRQRVRRGPRSTRAPHNRAGCGGRRSFGVAGQRREGGRPP
jgi:hypothetical protein